MIKELFIKLTSIRRTLLNALFNIWTAAYTRHLCRVDPFAGEWCIRAPEYSWCIFFGVKHIQIFSMTLISFYLNKYRICVMQWQCMYSVSPIYRGRVYRGIGYIAVACWTPFFCPPISRILQTWRPRARYFSRNRGNSLHSIGRRQFFAKSAHRDSLCSCSLETIFREINSSLPVNAGWNTCCAMGSHARRSIDTSIVSQSRVQLIQCQCKSRLQTANLGINNAFNQIVAPRCLPSLRQFKTNQACVIGRYSSGGGCTPK